MEKDKISPWLSVIVPIYFGKKYVSKIISMFRKNIEFAFGKECETDIELIFVNDSPEEAVDTKSLEYDGLEIKIVVNQKNVGIHQSRVNGLKHAKGKYVIFLDQDDEIKEEYLLHQIENIGEADAVLSNGIWRQNKLIYKDIKEQEDSLKRNATSIFVISPGQMMIKKDAIPQEWIENILVKNGWDDWFLWQLMLSQGKRFAFNPSVDYIHVEDGNNTSANFKTMKDSAENVLEIIQSKEIFCEEDRKRLVNIITTHIQKYDGYIDIINAWDDIIEGLLQYIKEQEIKSIGIYGYGVIGKKLIKALQDTGISVDCIIDKNAKVYVNDEYEVKTIEEINMMLDLVVITLSFQMDEVKDALQANRIANDIKQIVEFK